MKAKMRRSHGVRSLVAVVVLAATTLSSVGVPSDELPRGAAALGGRMPFVARHWRQAALGRVLGQRKETVAPMNYLRYYYPVPRKDPAPTVEADVCIYGATPAGIAAAIQASRMGKSAVIAEFGRHVGGMTASGLGATDTGNKQAIGGIAREFYRRLGAYYRIEGEAWTFEPKVAELTFLRMLSIAGVEVRFEQRLAEVEMQGGRIVRLEMEDGTTYRAAMFVDATYEGDLMAKAGVSYTVGRESNEQYGETLNGVQFGRPYHRFVRPVDPYVREGDPSSGLLWGVSAEHPGYHGEGDHRVQAYCFRMCLTRNPENRIPFARPEDYDARRYELLARYLAEGPQDVLYFSSGMPNDKTDVNNNGAFSTDNIGRNYEWPDGDYQTRERIFQDHVTYQKGLMWFLVSDPRVPESIRRRVSEWGLPKDEFEETGGWPHQLYIREGRRMVSDYVMTEHDCLSARVAPDSVGLASYTMDSHNCQRYVDNGAAQNEGDVQVRVPRPYPVSFRSIVPRRGDCENLLVPVCLSASHIAFGSIRMEPVYLVLGQSAGAAACLALDDGTSVQGVRYDALRALLLDAGQVLDWPAE
ncbi:MAG: hypothetical protein AMXMBFR61_27790 [Fimbriimonadales bacterium]